MLSFLRRTGCRLAFVLGLASFTVPAQAACGTIIAADQSYSVCQFDPAKDEMALYWRGSDGAPFASTDRLAADLAAKGRKLIFAMNAGMFDTALAPVGLYVENGRQIHGANTRNGQGNFHLKPNGVFYFGDGRAGVMETGRFLKARITAPFATQSGPMLVIDGQIHPKIQPTGSSEKIRNGVGVRDDGTVVFAISTAPVSFHAFAQLFRDQIGARNALFLDGSVSTFYAPPLPSIGGWSSLGPMLGVTTAP